jgi:hypothetical protein
MPIRAGRGLQSKGINIWFFLKRGLPGAGLFLVNHQASFSASN